MRRDLAETVVLAVVEHGACRVEHVADRALMVGQAPADFAVVLVGQNLVDRLAVEVAVADRRIGRARTGAVGPLWLSAI